MIALLSQYLRSFSLRKPPKTGVPSPIADLWCRFQLILLGDSRCRCARFSLKFFPNDKDLERSGQAASIKDVLPKIVSVRIGVFATVALTM